MAAMEELVKQYCRQLVHGISLGSADFWVNGIHGIRIPLFSLDTGRLFVEEKNENFIWKDTSLAKLR